ncbi:MAG: hypothetical protein JSU92_03945 [Deltaproteobacteria bacterium]|nr:MAG: hypothetical protein JSU92_03945 [Deltaproteobacteria bacterium]
MDKIELIPVRTKSDTKRFVKLPRLIYQDDPHWVHPLIFERMGHFNPRRNPFFGHSEVQMFIAVKDGKDAGRISAHIDQTHLKHYGDKTGFFGYFESIDDDTVAVTLLGGAENWLKERGMQNIRGPFSFNINDETGLLIEGFDSPPILMMPHNPPYYASLLEKGGYQKIKDVFAHKYIIGEVPEPSRQIAEQTKAIPGLKIREVDMRNYMSEAKTLFEVFNSAWSENWGYLPMTTEEMKYHAAEMKIIIDPELAIIAEFEGVPVAIAVALPNVNEAIADLKGRLLPWGIFKLIYRLKISHPKSGRLVLLGITPEFRKMGKAPGLSVLLYVEMDNRARRKGYEWGELSWTLEDNFKINRGIEMMGGVKYKTYRIYEKPL